MRTASRQLAKGPCFIVTHGETDGVQCSIHDYSGRGARLIVESADALPLHFKLYTAADREGIRCAVVWRKSNEVGIRFID